MSVAESVFQFLKEQGIRLTQARRAIISIFAQAESPLSAIELSAKLRELKITADKSTVYRELVFLLEQRIIKELDFLDGKKRYEFALEESHHHHHLVCRECDSVQCIELPNDLCELGEEIKKQFKFQVEDHVLEFFGKCADCCSKKGKKRQSRKAK